MTRVNRSGHTKRAYKASAGRAQNITSAIAAPKEEARSSALSVCRTNRTVADVKTITVPITSFAIAAVFHRTTLARLRRTMSTSLIWHLDANMDHLTDTFSE